MLRKFFSQRKLLKNIYLYESKHLSTTKCLLKVEDRKEMLSSLPAKDEGTVGEKSIDVDSLLQKKQQLFPDENTPKSIINNSQFSDIPICNIRASPNNTIITVCDSKGTPLIIRSCGIEGFKNTRKGTNIAAQAAAITISGKSIEFGMKTVRIQVRGLGPGRMSAIKGLQMGGLNIVSITDTTPVSWMPPRPRKQRKL